MIPNETILLEIHTLGLYLFLKNKSNKTSRPDRRSQIDHGRIGFRVAKHK